MKKVCLKPGKEKLANNRHPWIFSGALRNPDPSLSPGELVMLTDASGQEIGVGHFCGFEGLSVRMLGFDKVCVDDDFFLRRFDEAVKLRQSFGLPTQNTTGYRLIHGEGDGLSGLVCDVFGDYAVIASSNPGFGHVISLLETFLVKSLGIKTVLKDGQKGTMPFTENGLNFIADMEGQKTGHFLDQRDNRQLLKSVSHGRTVLDAFCYSGGFTTYGLKGGATSVVALDASETALHKVNEHIAHNGPFVGHHETICDDAFDYLRRMKQDHFDLIVLDPPAFAKSAKAVERAARGYKDINRLAIKNIKSAGILFTFSCSQHLSTDLFHKIIFASAKDAGREVVITHTLTQGLDHPVSVYCPQSSYLKGLVLYVK